MINNFWLHKITMAITDISRYILQLWKNMVENHDQPLATTCSSDFPMGIFSLGRSQVAVPETIRGNLCAYH